MVKEGVDVLEGGEGEWERREGIQGVESEGFRPSCASSYRPGGLFVNV